MKSKKAKHQKPLSWKPVLSGRVYCSPACGFGCSLRQYEERHRQGAELAAKLGRGWKARIWENMGWHYCVSLTGRDYTITVYGPSDVRDWHWADMRVDGEQFTADQPTAFGAVAAVVAAFRSRAAIFASAAEQINLRSPHLP